jgi:hypothetical protein
VQRAFAGNHAFAEQHFGALHGSFFYEVVVLHHQHLADVLGIIEKNDMVRTDLVVGDIAVSIGEVLKKKNRICRTELSQRKPQQIAPHAGRKMVSTFLW